MKWRVAFLLCCATVIALAGVTAASSSEAPWVCCASSSACQAAETCCSADIVGLQPCDGDTPGYCMEVCKRVAGPSTFTPD